MVYKTLADICRISSERKMDFWEVVREDNCREFQISPEDSFEKMRSMYRAMRLADETYDGSRRSRSGIIGGDGARMEKAVAARADFSGDFIGAVMERALKMGETNACMGRIVAAPTAGSCGVLPAVLITCEKEKGFSEDEIVEALFTAAGIGQIIAQNASIAGASGGCQAEIGTASAIAAGALVQLRHGSAEEICMAAAIALKGLMGLTCDPVAGLVEVPCVKRNVIGAVNAVTSSDMVMAGIRSAIPADEVISAMGEIGREMPSCYRETGKGGLAITPTAGRIRERIRSEKTAD